MSEMAITFSVFDKDGAGLSGMGVLWNEHFIAPLNPFHLTANSG